VKRWEESIDRRSFHPLPVDLANTRRLEMLLHWEIMIAMGFAPRGVISHLLRPVFRVPVRRFTQLAVRFDRLIEEDGFPEACRKILPDFVQDFEQTGADALPEEGPLLLAGNHPGLVDALILSQALCHENIRIIASGVPFMRVFPNLAKNLIYSSHDAGDRMRVVREAISHLRGGGALIVLPSGRIDPDPQVLPGAKEALELWSASLGMFVRSVPEIQIAVALTGGVLDHRSMKSPLLWLGNTSMEKQRLAEFFQVVRQMLSPGTVSVRPRVFFSTPFRLDQGHRQSPEEITRDIVHIARRLMESTFYPRGSNSTP